METPIGTERLLIQARLERDNLLDILEEEYAYKYEEAYHEMQRGMTRPAYSEKPRSLDAFNATWFHMRMTQELICYHAIVGEVEAYQTARGVVYLEMWPHGIRTIYFERSNTRLTIIPPEELPEF
jgi:hypothetical protein